MSRFDREFALVPDGGAVDGRSRVPRRHRPHGAASSSCPGSRRETARRCSSSPFFLASLVGVAFLGAFVLLVGYVFADARRRGMKHVLWTLLAIFIPNAIGIILYFILRDPIPVPCPACGTPARKGHAFCAGCGAAVRTACPAVPAADRNRLAELRPLRRRAHGSEPAAHGDAVTPLLAGSAPTRWRSAARTRSSSGRARATRRARMRRSQTGSHFFQPMA